MNSPEGSVGGRDPAGASETPESPGGVVGTQQGGDVTDADRAARGDVEVLSADDRGGGDVDVLANRDFRGGESGTP